MVLGAMQASEANDLLNRLGELPGISSEQVNETAYTFVLPLAGNLSAAPCCGSLMDPETASECRKRIAQNQEQYSKVARRLLVPTVVRAVLVWTVILAAKRMASANVMKRQCKRMENTIFAALRVR